MDSSKKRWLIALVLSVFLVIIASFIFFEKGGITGASVGLAEEEQSLGIGLEVSVNDESTNTIQTALVENETASEESFSIASVSESKNGGKVKVTANCGGVTTCNCGDTVTSSYTLAANLGPCTSPLADGLYTGANNLLIDCNGYSIVGSNAADSYGIYNDGYFNITVKNCNFSNFTNGLVYNAVLNGTIVNNTIQGTTYGIIISGATSNVTINSTTIKNSADIGILLNGVRNVTIFLSNISSSYTYDFKVIGSAATTENHTIYNNYLEGKVLLDGNADGVFLYNNIFWNATSITCNNVDNKWNTSLDCTRTNLKGGNCTGGNFYSNYTWADTDDNSIGNIIYNVSGTGSCQDLLPLVSVYQYFSPADATTRSLVINSSFNATNPLTNATKHSARQNITFSNATKRYLQLDAYFNATVNLNTLKLEWNDTVTTVNLTGVTGINATPFIYLANLNYQNGVVICPNAKIRAVTETNCTGAINLTYNNATEGSYVNGVKATIDGTDYKVENLSSAGVLSNPYAQLVVWDDTNFSQKSVNTTIKFYANYTDTGGRNISGANCSIIYHDGTGINMIFNESSKLYESNRSFPIPNLGTFGWNVTCNKSYYNTLSANDTSNITVLCGSTITTSLTFAESLYGCAGHGLVIGADSITLDCNGKTISGNAPNYGIVNANYDHVKVYNCTLANFYNSVRVYAAADNLVTNFTLESTSSHNTSNAGIQFAKLVSGTLLNNRIINSGYSGIYADNVNNTLLRGNVINNATISGLFLYYTNNNSFVNNSVLNSPTNSGSGMVELSNFCYNNTFENNSIYSNNISGFYLSSNTRENNIRSNIIFNNTYGIDVISSLSNQIYGNNISNNLMDGISVVSSSTNNNITYNTLSFNGANSNRALALGLSSTNNYILNNNISNNTGDGIEIRTDNNLISGNRIYNNTAYGIELSSANGNNLTNNSIFSNGASGIYSDTSSGYIRENNLSDNVEYGLYLKSNPSPHYIYNNIINNLLSVQTTYGIYLSSTANNNSFQGNTIHNTTYGIYLTASHNNTFTANNVYKNSRANLLAENSNNNLVIGGNFNGSASGIALLADSGNSGTRNYFKNVLLNNSVDVNFTGVASNNFLLNSTFNTIYSDSPDNYLLVKWYASINLRDLNNISVTGANVTAYNRTSGVESSVLSDSAGLARLELTEYLHNGSTKFYITPHTINVTLNGYFNSTTLNLTQTNSTSPTIYMNFSATSCGSITQSVTLTSNLNSNGTCFIVGADNLVINGNNVVVTGNKTDFGVNLTNRRNVTIHNVKFTNFSTGLYIYNSTNNTIYSSYFDNNTLGIQILNNSNRNNLSTNYVRNNTLNGTLILNSSNNLIYNNYFYLNGNHAHDNSTNKWNISYICSSGSAVNILQGDCWGGNYWNYSITDANFDGIGDSAYSIPGSANQDLLPLVQRPLIECGTTLTTSTTLPFYRNLTATSTCFTVGANNIVIDGSGITITGDNGTDDKGIYVAGYDNVTIKNFTIKDFYYGGIHFKNNGADACFNNIISHVNVQSSGYPLFLSYFNGGNISNSTFNNSGENYYGVFLSDSENNTFTSTVFDSDGYGVYLGYDTDMTTIKDSSITSVNQSVYSPFSSTTRKYAYLRNTTANQNFTSRLNYYVYRQWYSDVNITNTSSIAVSDANVTAYDATNAVDNSVLSGANGIARLILKEYYFEDGITYVTTANHTIKVTKLDYTENSTLLNIRHINNTQLNLTIQALSCGMMLGSNAQLGSNYTATGNCFNFISNNVSLQGNGYYLIGDGTGIGLNLSGRFGLNISNLRIANFTKGIYLNDTNYSKFNDVIILNSTIGIYLSESTGNRFYDSNFTNNSQKTISLINTGYTNNTFINSSINLSAVEVNGTATLFYGWYADVNVTLNGSIPLQGVNVTGYFNSTNESDYSKNTGANGIARLELLELKKNNSGIFYLTPHKINATYTGGSLSASNATTINLTQTNNVKVNLSLQMNCTVPSDNLELTSNTLFCPGTYNLGERIYLKASNLNVTCSGTILIGDDKTGGRGIYNDGYDNITLHGCEIRSNYRCVEFLDSENSTLTNIVTNNCTTGIYGHNINRLILTNFNSSSHSYGLFLSGSYNVITNLTASSSEIVGVHLSSLEFSNFTKGRISTSPYYGAFLTSSDSNQFRNITFSGNAYGVYMDSFSQNNSFSNNNFTGSSGYHMQSGSATNLFNITSQGNEWSDYCDKGSDSNSDGYADAVSSAGNDWPYNSTTSSKFYGSGADYGPKIIPCPPTEVMLGSSSGGGGGRSTAAATATTPAPTATSTPTIKVAIPPPTTEMYTLNEARQHLKTNILTQQSEEKLTTVSVTLENTGKKTMFLLPQLSQDVEDPYYIITRKTLGGEDSLFSKISSLSYSRNSISGRLLKAEIINPEQITLAPGEKLEKTLEIKEGLVVPKQMKIQFTTLGETVQETEITTTAKTISATAVDIDTAEKTIDLYAVIVPAEAYQETPQNNPLTGAAIGILPSKDYYFLELTISRADSDKALFIELYGPYSIKQQQSLVFGQQLKYNPQFYRGNYKVKTKIYQKEAVAAENEFQIELK